MAASNDYIEAARAAVTQAPNLTIPSHPEVQVVEGGAYVQCVLWVPESAVPKEGA